MIFNFQNQRAQRAVMDAIMTRRSFTIPEIAQASGLSMTTVAKYVAHLQGRHVLEVVAPTGAARQKGRQPVLYRMRSDYSHFLGVDVKPFGLHFGLMNLTGDLVAEAHFPDFIFENTYGKVNEICVRVREFLAEHPAIGTVARVNFNFGGRVNSRTGTSASIFNFEDTQEIPLSALLGEHLGLPVFIENDTKAMSYGDYLTRHNPEWRNVLYVNIGWGLGLGIIIDGQIYYGHEGYSGEFGHVRAYDNDIICHCGRKGCLETEVSGRAIFRKLRERVLYHHAATVLSRKIWDNRTVTTLDLVHAVEQGDPLCRELVSAVGRELGFHVAGLINLFNPDCIIVGGHIAQVDERFFLEPLKQEIRKNSFLLMNRSLPVITSPLGANAGIVGACLIARNETLRGLFRSDGERG